MAKNPNTSSNKRLWILALSALVLIGAAFFALTLYSSSVAEKRLQEWVARHDLQDQLQWRSVRSSPFGGRVKISDLQIRTQKSFWADAQAIDVETLKINGFKSNQKQVRADLFFEGVRFMDAEGRPELPSERLYEGGRNQLAPFDLHVDFDLHKNHLDLALDAQLPETFAFDFQLQLDEMPDISELQKIGQPAQQGSAPMPPGSMPPGPMPPGPMPLGSLMKKMEQITLAGFFCRVEDEGYFKRRNALLQRHEYVSALDPAADDIAGQRKEANLRFMQENIQACEKSIGSKASYGKALCTALGELGGGKGKGFAIRVKAEKPLKLGRILTALMMQKAPPEMEALKVETEKF